MSTCSVHPLPYRANPAEYFAAIRHAPGAVLLDSGRPVAERGRYDLLSAWPWQTLTVAPDESGNDFLQRLRKNLTQLGEADLPVGYELPFAGGLIGYLSYDFGRHLEQMPHVAVDDLHLPDARFGLYAWALISDHQAKTSQLVFHPALDASERQRLTALFSAETVDSSAIFKLQGPMAPDLSAESYRQAIVRIQEYIQAGDCYQVNLAQVRALHIHKAVDQVQVHVQPRIHIEEVGDHRRQVPAPKRCRRIHSDQALRRMAQGHRFGPRQLQFTDNPSRPLGKCQPSRGRHHGVGAALEQAAAHGVFQAVDTPRHRRGRQGMAARGGGKAAAFQYIEEQAQLVGQGIRVHGKCLCEIGTAIVRCCAFPC